MSFHVVIDAAAAKASRVAATSTAKDFIRYKEHYRLSDFLAYRHAFSVPNNDFSSIAAFVAKPFVQDA